MTSKAEGQLIALDEVRVRLAKVSSVDEAKGIRDKAEALRHYAKQQGLGLEAQNKAAEIKIRAERRAGEILAEIERKDHKPTKTTRHAGGSIAPTYSQTIEKASIPETTARRWQAEASVPERVFEQFVATAKDSQAELTSAALVRFATATQGEAATRKAAGSGPSVVWAKNMRRLTFAVRSLIAIASEITADKKQLVTKELSRCISVLSAAKKEIE